MKACNPRRPAVVAFDVVETLFALDPLRPRFAQAGLPEGALGEWFARFLRDAMALDAAGTYVPFRAVAAGTLEAMLAGSRPDCGPAVEDILHGFLELPAHGDVRPAFTLLRDAGVRILALTNGRAQVTQHLLHRADLDAFVERVVSIDEVQHWKPRPEVYRHAASVAGVPADRAALVAAHAWDVLGARRAGLLTGWVARVEARFHPAMGSPTVRGDSLTEVAAALLALDT